MKLVTQIIDNPDSDHLYLNTGYNDYQILLKNHGNDEDKFQEFFEKNPGFIPGAFNMFGESGHGSLRLALISQPKIAGLFDRFADFMWLAKDSMNFNPIIVEIEAPNKKLFTKNGTPHSDFTKAKNQLTEWKTLIQRPENVFAFYEAFSIPMKSRKLRFKPYYVLIYGRREEFAHDTTLTQKRSNLMGEDEILMSFDRLDIHLKCFNAITCNVKQGKFIAKYLSPIFKASVDQKSRLKKIQNINDAIENSAYMTDRRKKFLIHKISEIVNSPNKEKKIKLPTGRSQNDAWE